MSNFLSLENDDTMIEVTVPDGYETLMHILNQAFDRAAYGKGKARHAKGQPFADQSIIRITQGVGTGFPFGQAIKKLTENHPTSDSARENYLDAIVYIAAGILAMDLDAQSQPPSRRPVDATEVGSQRATA